MNAKHGLMRSKSDLFQPFNVECIFVNSCLKVLGKSDKRGPESCPRIENEDNSSEILVSSGSEISLRVKVVHLQVTLSFLVAKMTIS